MKKLLALLLAACLLLSLTPALAIQFDENESTFESFEEVCENGPANMTAIRGGTWAVNDPLKEYPAGTTWIYRSANRWSSATAGYRKNTVIGVYTAQKFASKDEALAFLKDTGLVDIIEEAKGSIILVNPIGDTFGAEDARAYYLMQAATCDLGGTVSDPAGGSGATALAGAYFGGTTYRYAIGIDDGATFLNNYVASQYDNATRLAGMILIGGKMDRIHDVGGIVPVYMVNPTATALAKYQAVNETDRHGYKGDVDYYYSQTALQKVLVKYTEKVDLAAEINYGYYNLLVKYLRVPCVLAGLHTYSGDYTSGNWNQAPYSLGERNAFFLTGTEPTSVFKTADGLVIEEFIDDESPFRIEPEEGATDSYGNAAQAQVVTTWYEILPQEVIDGTAGYHTVPVWLQLHGGGDDPLQYLDEMGFMTLAGKERFAMIAPCHSPVWQNSGEVMPQMVEYFLEKFPALDPSRVYVTGYSMGGGSTLNAINGNAKYFAAATPNAAAIFGSDFTPDVVERDDYDLPIMFTTATYDFCGFGGVSGFAATPKEGDPYDPEHINEAYQDIINEYLDLNGIAKIDYDFETYPISGFRGDEYWEKWLNNEYMNRTWFVYNEKGIPMVGLNVTDYMPHGLYQEFGPICWEYAKHFSRDQETFEVIFNPYVD